MTLNCDSAARRSGLFINIKRGRQTANNCFENAFYAGIILKTGIKSNDRFEIKVRGVWSK